MTIKLEIEDDDIERLKTVLAFYILNPSPMVPYYGTPLVDLAMEIEHVESARDEAAYDRHQEHLMETGGGPTLREQQIAAQKFK